jgi:hypothetical protein
VPAFSKQRFSLPSATVAAALAADAATKVHAIDNRV